MKITDPTIKGRLGVNAMKAKKHLYDHIIYDSTGERDFAAELDTNKDVAVYVKLPDGFYISTPVGRYNPDWAIAFYKGNIKHIYFVAETKGSVDDTDFEWLMIDASHTNRNGYSIKNFLYGLFAGIRTRQKIWPKLNQII